MRTIFAIIGVMFLAGCASPLPLELKTARIDTAPAEEISVAVVDHRDFILNGDKPAWFEGIIRSVYGIPVNLERPGADGSQPFARYLATMIEGGIEKSGGQAVIIDLPPGMQPEAAREFLAREKRRALLTIMYKSRYDVGFSADYQYDFVMSVLDAEGRVMAEERFSGWPRPPLSDTYTIFDMFTEIYSNQLSQMLADPAISAALQKQIAAAAN